MKTVAVIILNWNGEKLLSEFLPSVVANTPDALADIIVADNGSTDGSLDLLRREFPEVKVLEFSENYGFAGGYNRAIAQTGYPITVLLNSDVRTPRGWLPPLVELLNSHPEAAACQPKILSHLQPGRFEYAGAAGGFLDRNGYPYCRGRIFSTVEDDLGQYDTPMEIFWATGACLAVRTPLYLEVGGLDEKFFAHMEEIDLCWRLKLAGYTLWAVPESKVYHLGGGSLPAENPRKTYLNFRNNLLLLHKNLPEADLRSALLRRRLLDTLAWLRFILMLDFPNARAILRAHRDFRRMRRDYPNHPSLNLLHPSASSAATPAAKPTGGSAKPSAASLPNILIEYYLRGRRRFSSLPKSR